MQRYNAKFVAVFGYPADEPAEPADMTAKGPYDSEADAQKACEGHENARVAELTDWLF
jgi:hypothetical protein